jgi:hypothetical protein
LVGVLVGVDVAVFVGVVVDPKLGVTEGVGVKVLVTDGVGVTVGVFVGVGVTIHSEQSLKISVIESIKIFDEPTSLVIYSKHLLTPLTKDSKV